MDGYAPNVEITDAPQDYGQISLPAGSNTITITLTGKAPGRPATTPARLAAGYTGNWPCKWIATCAKSGAAQS